MLFEITNCSAPLNRFKRFRLSGRAAQLIKENDWDLLLVVAETGEWLKKKEISEVLKYRENAKMAVIVADKAFSSELNPSLALFLEKESAGCRGGSIFSI
ncbi:MAG: hypothetical protein RBT11_16775 [Desulfobacterales bacterium]|jgi:hypothetical protein|nr:hypothetical protein [Desulfobacterales bacterium]